MIKNIRLFAGATLLMVAFSSCYKNEFGVVDLTNEYDSKTCLPDAPSPHHSAVPAP